MDPYFKLMSITCCVLWAWFFILRFRSIVRFFKGIDELKEVLMDSFAGWMFFFFAMVFSNVLLISWIYFVL